MTFGLVLCGGESRRMGTAKALLPWRGGTLLGHAVGRLRAAGLEPLCAGPAEWAEAALCRPLADEPPGAGPLGGIAAGLALGDVFVLAVDMPLLTPDEIARLVARGRERGLALVPEAAGRLQPLAAFWPQTLRRALAQYLGRGERSVVGFLEGEPHVRLDEPALRRLGVDPGHLRGANTPDAWEALQREEGQP